MTLFFKCRQSSALANANAQNQYFGPQGFGGSAAAAQGNVILLLKSRQY